MIIIRDHEGMSSVVRCVVVPVGVVRAGTCIKHIRC